MALQIAESTTSPGFMDLEVGSGYRRGEIDVNHHETGLKRSDRVPVVLIAGYGRSGSTLLDRLLGQVDGFCSVGEMRFLWQWGGVENQLCGCSARFRNCPFWTQVLESAFGSGTKADMAHLARLKERIERKRNLLYLRVPSAAPQSFNDARLEYELALSRIYASILKVSGCHHIIDSSKNPSRGYLLSGMNDIRLDILHLIRDSRAVAYSWQRKKVRPEIHWKKELMPRHGVLHACAEWCNVPHCFFQKIPH